MTQKAEARGSRIKDRPEFQGKPKPLTCGPETTVEEAAMAMSDNRYGSVVVVNEDQQVLGIVTERDVLNKIVAKALDPSEQKLSDVMTTKVRVANENDDLIDWLRIMSNERFRRLPIVDADGRISAVFTQGDFVSYTWPDLVFQAWALVKATAGRNIQYILIFGGIGLYALLMLIVLNTL
jgi:CBS domain-containing protein